MGAIKDEMALIREEVRRRDPELAALDAAIVECRVALDALVARRRKHLEAKSPIQVGDEVEVQLYGKDRAKWRRAIVRKVITGTGIFSDGFEYRISLAKASGWSDTVRHNVRDIRKVEG